METCQEVNILELAEIERAKSGKIYAAGCILVKLSSADDSVVFLPQEGEIETRYAVIIPKSRINRKYLHISICRVYPEWLQKHRTGINLQFDELKYLDVMIHNDAEVQQRIVEQIQFVQEAIEKEETILNDFRDMKKYFLSRMMC